MVETIYWYEYTSKKKAKNNFEKDLAKLINNKVLRKTMENVRKHRSNKLVTTERRNQLLSEQSYHTTNFLAENLLAIEKMDTDIVSVYT